MPLGELQESMHLGAGLPVTRRKAMTSLGWRKISHTSTAFFALAVISTTPVHAADYDVGSIHVTSPWARATPKGASSGAAYFTITNNGAAPDRVTCVSSDVSAGCQIHTMTMDNGVMKMRPVEGGLELKPGETVTLKPSGFHVMLMDLKHPLEQGKMAEATLQFEKAGTLKVDFPIVAIGAAAPGTPAGGGNMMEGHGGMMRMDKH
jgi:periplasmic copper chaperone A